MDFKTLIKKWWFWVIVVVIICGIGAAVEPQQEQEQQAESGHSISESAAETFCQDAGLLGKYLNLDNYSVISILDYNKLFGSFDGWFDSDGNPILYLRWGGKDKLTDQTVRFDCWISGTDENIRLHKLSVDTTVLEDITPASVQDENGTHIFAE